MTIIHKALLLLPLAYLLGSIPCGVILTRIFSDVDVRSTGSKNIGAYNVFRVAGIRLGLITLAGDLMKGAIPVMAGILWIGGQDWTGEAAVCLVALAAFAGHLYPVLLGFKGGKGVATAAGCFLVISPLTFLVCLLVYVLVVCCLGYSSAGSLAATATLPVAIWMTTNSFSITGCASIMAILIFIRHKDNIKRIIKGAEHSAFRP